jgi:fucose permease
VLKAGIGDENKAAYLTSVFWGSLTIGRLLGVPIGARFRPQAILLTDLIGCFVSIGIALTRPGSIVAISLATVVATTHDDAIKSYAATTLQSGECGSPG